MGSRYVTRHVFDENHRLLCCRDKSKKARNKVEKRNINYPVPYPVIGGICIRPFYERNFGEVVFLAVHNQHQHKSVGRKILRVMKHVAVREGLDHFYTYADNRALGFFQKMGFVKKRSAHCSPNKVQKAQSLQPSNKSKKEPFWDYIKHYTGSELMECKLYNKVNYIALDANLCSIEKDLLIECNKYRKQHFAKDMAIEYEPNEAFLIPIRKLVVILELDDDFKNEQDDEVLLQVLAEYGIVNDRNLYDVYKTQKTQNGTECNLKEVLTAGFGSNVGSKLFDKFVHYLTKPNDKLVLNHIDLPSEIEGVKAEWNAMNDGNANILSARRSSRFFPVRMKASWILKRLSKNDDAYPFSEPVPRDVEGYYERIKHPMDLQTMTEANDRGSYSEWKQFDADFRLMIANCKEFNEPGSEIVKMCCRLSEYYTQCVIKYDRTMLEKKVRK